MKNLKFAIPLLLCVISFNGFSQSRLNLKSGQFTKITQTIPTKSVEYADDGVIVTYSIPTADEITTGAANNEIIWGIQGFTNNTGEGNPAVPMRNDIFSFEGCADISVELIEENHTDYMVNIAPFSDPENREGDAVMTPYKGFFPEEPIFIRGKEEYRGNDISYVAVCPVLYDYENSIARAYTKLKYKISYAENAVETQSRIRNKAFGQSFSTGVNTFANVAIPLVKKEEAENPILKAGGSGDILETPEDYLIITSLGCRPAAEKLARWKRILGFNVTVSSKMSWSETAIKNAISNFYSSTMNPTYVLFLGNANSIPPQTFVSNYMNQSFVTDYRYMCMGGEQDELADLVFGRIPANNLTDAYNAVDKIIRYEQGVNISTANMHKGVHLSYFEDNNKDGIEESHFIRTSEIIKDHLVANENKTVDRLYIANEGVTPQRYCNKFVGIYRSSQNDLLPAELRSSSFEWHRNVHPISNKIINLWKTEPLYVLYISHSNYDGWKQPAFSVDSVYTLNSVKNPPFIFSMSCQAGGFDKEKCLAKEVICQKGAGVNIIASTSPGWKGFQDVMCETMFNCIFPAHFWNHSFELNAIPSSNGIDVIDSIQNPSFKRFSVATTLEQAKNYINMWLINDGGTFEDFSSPTNDNYRRYMSDTRMSFENFGDPTIVMPTYKPSRFRAASVTRTANAIFISGVDFSNSKVSFYNPNTGQLLKYFSYGSSAFFTDTPEDWIVCVKGNEMIPFVDFGENAQIDVTPVY